MSLLASLACVAGCDAPDFVECDGGAIVDADGVPTCVARDAGREADVGPLDAGMSDAGMSDAGPPDAAVFDAAVLDAGSFDGGALDAGSLDAGADGGVPDAGPLEAFDAPDCVDDFACPFDARTVLDLTATTEVSLHAYVDGADHTIPTSCGDRVSADRDVYRVRAPVRSLVEIEITPDAGGALEPVLEGFGVDLANLALFASTSGPLRAVMIVGAPPPEGLTLQLHHEAAYGSLCAGAPPSFRGGADYGYTITARLCTTCAIEELGALGGGLSTTASLDRPGEMRVYRFTAASDATPTVSVARSGACPAALSGACCPIVVPLVPGGDTPAAVRASYTSTAGRTCDGDTRSFPATNASGERLFAVYDYESLGAPGYDVSVTVSP